MTVPTVPLLAIGVSAVPLMVIEFITPPAFGWRWAATIKKIEPVPRFTLKRLLLLPPVLLAVAVSRKA